jgi:hypothetical protein
MIDANKLSVRPLFYDALSGLFAPVSDELGRSHTLGRLAYATCVRGEEPDDDVSHHFSYSPSWARYVVSTVVCYTEPNSTTLTMSSLHLKNNKNVTQLWLHDYEEGDGSRSLVMIDDLAGPQELAFPFATTELDIVRDYVTAKAEDYFNLAELSISPKRA